MKFSPFLNPVLENLGALNFLCSSQPWWLHMIANLILTDSASLKKPWVQPKKVIEKSTLIAIT